MLDVTKILVDGGLFALIFTVYILALVIYNQRLILNPGDIPADILAAVPPKTEEEQRLSVWLGIPFFILMLGIPAYSTYTFALQNPAAGYWLLFGHIFFVSLIPNLFDLIVLDWLLFCTIQPSFFVFPGTEGFFGYRDYGFHLRQHAKAFPILVVVIAVVAWVVLLIA